MNNISIEKINNIDINKVLSVEDDCFKNPWNKEQFLYEINDNPFAKLFVLKLDNKIIGYIDYMITFNSATVSKVAIKKDYRKNGYASKLIEHMLNDLRSLGYGEIETITLEVRISNKSAINLYNKFGFDIVTTKKGYYDDGEDAYYMMKVML